MKEILYIYRDIKTSDFIISDKEKKIIPVWLKNEYNNSNFINNGLMNDVDIDSLIHKYHLNVKIIYYYS